MQVEKVTLPPVKKARKGKSKTPGCKVVRAGRSTTGVLICDTPEHLANAKKVIAERKGKKAAKKSGKKRAAKKGAKKAAKKGARKAPKKRAAKKGAKKGAKKRSSKRRAAKKAAAS